MTSRMIAWGSVRQAFMRGRMSMGGYQHARRGQAAVARSPRIILLVFAN
jgi:hypothetical protein